MVGPVLDRFDEVGLVDDASYAEMIVRTRHAERGLSRRAIAVELRRRGIDEDVAADALEQVDGDDERQAALVLARKLMRDGADALVIEGTEAGGHIGPVSTGVLAQEILPVIREIPVFVAGGIGRGEAIGEALARLHRLLRHPGHPVHGVRHADAVPVDRRVLGKPVVQLRRHDLSARHAQDERPLLVIGPYRCRAAPAGQPHRPFRRRQTMRCREEGGGGSTRTRQGRQTGGRRGGAEKLAPGPPLWAHHAVHLLVLAPRRTGRRSSAEIIGLIIVRAAQFHAALGARA